MFTKLKTSEPMAFAEIIGFTAATMALSALSIDIMLPALSLIGEDLSASSDNDAQLVIFSFAIGYGVAHLFFGPLADRFGRRPVMLWSIGAFCGAAALATLAPSFTLLLCARALQGCAAAAARVAVFAMVRDRYAGRRMAEVISAAVTVFIAAPVLAPAIGQAILFAAPWRAIFGALFFYGAFLLLWTWLRASETLEPALRRPFNMASSMGAYSAFARNRCSAGYTAASALLFGAFYTYLGTAQQIYVGRFDLGPLFPLAFAGGAIPYAAATFFNARFVGRLGMRRIAHAAMIALIAINAVHLLVIALVGEHLAVYIGFICATLFALGLFSPNATSLAMEPMGHIAGAAAAANGFASATAAALIGAFVGRFYAGDAALIPSGFLVLGVAALAVVYSIEDGRLFHPQHGAAEAAE